MNSIEMTSNVPANADGQNTLPTLPQDAFIHEEFSFNSSNKMKVTNHLRKFRWFGAAIILLVTIVTFSTILHTSKLKEASRKRAATLNEAALSQIQGRDSELVLNGKTTTLWSPEDSESSDDDEEDSGEAEVKNGTSIKKAGKVTTKTRKLEVNGSIFKDAWRAMRGKTSKFVVLRQNVWNPRLVDAKLGEWSSTFTEFKAEIPATEAAIGFIYLGNTGQERFYEIVYIPSSMEVLPADIVSRYGLPSDPNELAKVSGCPVANTVVIRSFRELNALNIMKNAKAGAVVSLWGNEGETESSDGEEEVDEVVASSAVLAADGANYASVWSAMKSKFNRFVVFKKNANKIEAKLGGWNSLVSEFQAQFPANDEAVGFMILGSGSSEQLYEVVYVPASKTTKPSQVLANFGLPSNPALLRSNGLKVANTLVVRNYRDINTNNLVLNAKTAGIVSAWEEEGLVSLWWGSSEDSNDGSTYSEVWNTLKDKTQRFVIFRKNANNSELVDVTYGDWNTTSTDFASAFKVNKAQVGYIYLGTKNHEKLYEVVYAPVTLRTNPATILVSFGLPPNPSNLAQFGIEVPSTFVATDKKQIDTGNIIMKAVNAGIISAWSNEEEIVASSAVLAADGANYASVWNTIKAKTNRFVVFRKSAANPKQVEARLGSWNTLVSDFQAQFPVDQEAVGFMVLGSGAYEQLFEVVYIPSGKSLTASQVLTNFGLPTNPALLRSGLQVADTIVVKNYKDITSTNIMMNSKKAGIISLWEKEENETESSDDEEEVDEVVASNAILAADGANYASVWNTVKAKTNRFVVFRKSAANPKQVEARLGSWNTLVSDFQAQFPVDQEAVGFMVLGSGAYEQLFEVVYIPSGKSLTASQVLTNFGLPTNPALLRSGLQVADTIVIKNYKDITSTNIMMNSKKAGIISLWDDEEVNEVVESTQVLAADGANYVAIWNELKGKTKRFVVFRKNANNPKQIEAKIGAWSALVADFQGQFLADQEAVGFMILGSDLNPQLYEVVYIPSTKNISPAQVVANFGLPANPALLKSNGLQVANTLVVRNYNDISTMNMVLNSKQGGIISLWDESARLLAADGANYAPVWNTIKSKTSRFVVFRKSPTNPKQIEAKIGTWNALVSDFQAQFIADQEAVGFIILGSGAYEQLFEVVYVPSSKLTASQVLANFNLPTNPALLKSGLPQTADTIVIKNYKDITSTNIMMNSKKAGIISAWEEEENDSDSTDDGESETEVQSLWWSSSEDSNDGSTYSEVWNTLKEKTKKFVIFRKNAENAQMIDVTYGDWNTSSADFASSFRVNKPQVGYIYLGTKNHEKLYEVVYAPVALRTNPATILVSFGLPPNPNNLAQFGIEVPSTFVATDKKQIDTGNIILKATPSGIVS